MPRSAAQAPLVAELRLKFGSEGLRFGVAGLRLGVAEGGSASRMVVRRQSSNSGAMAWPQWRRSGSGWMRWGIRSATGLPRNGMGFLSPCSPARSRRERGVLAFVGPDKPRRGVDSWSVNWLLGAVSGGCSWAEGVRRQPTPAQMRLALLGEPAAMARLRPGHEALQEPATPRRIGCSQ